jgi:hypothetical protein
VFIDVVLLKWVHEAVDFHLQALESDFVSVKLWRLLFQAWMTAEVLKKTRFAQMQTLFIWKRKEKCN